jgi:hypothetical protein
LLFAGGARRIQPLSEESGKRQSPK